MSKTAVPDSWFDLALAGAAPAIVNTTTRTLSVRVT